MLVKTHIHSNSKNYLSTALYNKFLSHYLKSFELKKNWELLVKWVFNLIGCHNWANTVMIYNSPGDLLKAIPWFMLWNLLRLRMSFWNICKWLLFSSGCIHALLHKHHWSEFVNYSRTQTLSSSIFILWCHRVGRKGLEKTAKTVVRSYIQYGPLWHHCG